MYAISTFNDMALQDMLDDQADVNARDPAGIDALWLATITNRAHIIRMLLAAGADASHYGLSNLLLAANAGHAKQKQLAAGTTSKKYWPQPCVFDTWHRITNEALVAWFEQHGRKVRHSGRGQ